jgi:release factor glutamine methyltransferase
MSLTIRGALAEATRQLDAATPSPRVDSEVLVMHVTGLTRTGLFQCGDDSLSSDQQRQLVELLARRAHGEPVAYLTGVREFWSLTLHVTPDTLIPRPETELLVERTLAIVPKQAAWTVADLGTGSGAVALAVASERPQAQVIATDSSEAALAVARANAKRLGIANIEFRHGDWLAALGDTAIDLIVSNPPYLRADDPHLLEGDVRFEPRSALVAGADGLDAIRHIAAAALGRLRPGGRLLFEHGYDQGATARAILLEKGYLEVESFRDLAEHDRVTGGVRR